MRKKQFAIIGLGNLGFHLATQLYKKGHEVLAIDKNPTLVQEIKDSVSQAVVADATDCKVLEALDLKEMDAVVVCIGSSLNNSILTAMHLNDIGVKLLIAKALSESHGRILEKLGVHRVVFPEKDVGINLAEQLHNPNMIDYLPVIEGYTIVQMPPPPSFVGKTLQEIDMTKKYGVQLVAVKDTKTNQMNIVFTGMYFINESDKLFILGPNEALERLQEG
jgi:trk system potassium uptake protein TrkA